MGFVAAASRRPPTELAAELDCSGTSAELVDVEPSGIDTRSRRSRASACALGDAAGAARCGDLAPRARARRVLEARTWAGPVDTCHHGGEPQRSR